MFKAYSTRLAAASKAASKDLPLESILKMGHWRQMSTFFKFYLRRVKYFSRSHQTPYTVTNINLKDKNYSIVPASPAHRVAAHSLRRILKKRYSKPVKPVFHDVAPHKQGYVNTQKRKVKDAVSQDNDLNSTRSNFPSPTFSVCSVDSLGILSQYDSAENQIANSNSQNFVNISDDFSQISCYDRCSFEDLLTSNHTYGPISTPPRLRKALHSVHQLLCVVRVQKLLNNHPDHLM